MQPAAVYATVACARYAPPPPLVLRPVQLTSAGGWVMPHMLAEATIPRSVLALCRRFLYVQHVGDALQLCGALGNMFTAGCHQNGRHIAVV